MKYISTYRIHLVLTRGLHEDVFLKFVVLTLVSLARNLVKEIKKIWQRHLWISLLASL